MNLTFQAMPGADFDKLNVSNPALNYNGTFHAIPWLQCPCASGTNCPTHQIELDTRISLRQVSC